MSELQASQEKMSAFETESSHHQADLLKATKPSLSARNVPVVKKGANGTRDFPFE